jgi:hypothetical protein
VPYLETLAISSNNEVYFETSHYYIPALWRAQSSCSGTYLIWVIFMQRIDKPVVADKFLHLKHLKIFISINYHSFSPAYDYLFLISFLDASPLLETFILSVSYYSSCKDI